MKTIIFFIIFSCLYLLQVKSQNVQIEIKRNLKETDTSTAKVQITKEKIIIINPHLLSNKEIIDGINSITRIENEGIDSINIMIHTINQKLQKGEIKDLKEMSKYLDKLTRKMTEVHNNNMLLEENMGKYLLQDGLLYHAIKGDIYEEKYKELQEYARKRGIIE
jgi:hypothetical protein